MNLLPEELVHILTRALKLTTAYITMSAPVLEQHPSSATLLIVGDRLYIQMAFFNWARSRIERI